MGADAEFDALRAAMDHAHLAIIRAQNIRADLPHDRLEALANGGAAGNHFDDAIGVDIHMGAISRPQTALLDEEREARADDLALGPPRLQALLQGVPIHGLERLVKQAFVVAGIIGDIVLQHAEGARIGHLFLLDEIDPAHIHPRNSQPFRDGVQQALAHEVGLVTAGRAIGGAGGLVGEAVVARRAIGAQMIGPRQDAAGGLGDAQRMGARIGALIMIKRVADGEQAPLRIHRRADEMALLARLVGAHEMLAPILDPFHRTLEAQGGDEDQNVLGVDLAANAETPAHMIFEEVQRCRRAPEHARQRLTVLVRHLGRAMELQHITRAVIAPDGAARLQRHARMAPHLQIQRDNRMGAGEGALHIAKALGDDGRLRGQARREDAGRRVRLDDDRELLDIELHEIGGVLRHIGVLGEDHRHGLAHITHIVLRQHGLAIGLQLLDLAFAEIDGSDVRDVLRGPDGVDALQRQRGLSPDAQQAPVGEGRAHHAHMQLMGKADVGDEAPLAPHQRGIFKAGEALADDRLARLSHGRPSCVARHPSRLSGYSHNPCSGTGWTKAHPASRPHPCPARPPEGRQPASGSRGCSSRIGGRDAPRRLPAGDVTGRPGTEIPPCGWSPPPPESRT